MSLQGSSSNTTVGGRVMLLVKVLILPFALLRGYWAPSADFEISPKHYLAAALPN